MATVNGYTAEYMEILRNQTVIGGSVDGAGDLYLETVDGTLLPAGHVAGADATPMLGITDSDTIDLTLLGLGTVSSPWNISAQVRALPPGALVKGLLPATYRGGPSKVKVAGVLSSVEYSWMTPYVPGASREVNLMKVGTSFVIMGQTNESYVPLELDHAVARIYPYALSDANFSTMARAQKTTAGIVTLSGLIRTTGANVAGATVTTLPVGYRPDKELLMPVLVSSTSGVLRIKVTGEIQLYAAYSANAYINFDGLAFPAAGVATWTDIGTAGSAFSANFETTSTWITTFGTPAYWKDPYGFMWFRGLLRPKVTISTDNTVMFTLPAGYVADQPQHLRGCSEGTFAHYQFSTTGMNWKTNNPGAIGDWQSLCGLIGVTADGRTGNPWKPPGLLVNSFVNHSASYPDAQYVRREDGLCFTGGLVKTGVGPDAIFGIPEEEYWPTKGRLVLATASSSLAARLDIGSYRETVDAVTYKPGAIISNNGTASWFSLDGKTWIP